MIDQNQYNEMFNLQKKIYSEVGDIKRAIYGDQVNKVPGLIDRQLIDEVEIKKLKDAKKKFAWIAAGFVLALQFLREWILKIFE